MAEDGTTATAHQLPANIHEIDTASVPPGNPYHDELLEAQDSHARTYTFDEAMDEIGFGFYQFLLMQVSGCGWLFDGFEITLAGFLMPILRKEWNLSPMLAGLMGSIVFFGMMLGSFFGGMLGDKYGRKFVCVFGAAVTAFFALASAFSPGPTWYLIFRALVGVGLGATVPTDLSYFMEFLPRKSRGSITQWLNMYWNVGSVMECALAWALMDHSSKIYLGWRYVVAISSIPGFISLFFRLFIFESPRYCLIHGQENKAFHIVQTVAKFNCKKVPHGRLTHVPDSEHEMTSGQRLSFLFSPKFATTTLLIWGIWCSQTFAGWGFGFVVPTAFAELHNNPYLNYMIFTAISSIGNFVLIFFVEYVDRKKLMVITYLMSAVLSALTGAWSNPYWLLIVGTIANTLINIPWATLYVYTPEVYPTPVRSTAVGAGTAAGRIGATLAPIIGYQLLASGYFLPFVIFGASFLVSAICAAILPYETRGRPMADSVILKNTITEGNKLDAVAEEDKKRASATMKAPLLTSE